MIVHKVRDECKLTDLIGILISILGEALPQQIPSYPFGIFDKVAPTGTLGNPLWKDAVLDGLLRHLDDVGKLGIVREMIEVSAVVAWEDRKMMFMILPDGTKTSLFFTLVVFERTGA